MGFQAIVHAPALRCGARLCVSDVEQRMEGAPARLAQGDPVSLRFGACCPTLASASIESVEGHSAVLRHANDCWEIRRGSDGITLPGLVSEDWFVVQRRA